MSRYKNAETGICRTCESGRKACCLRDECDNEGIPIYSCAHHRHEISRVSEIIDAHAENNRVLANKGRLS